MPNHKTTLTVLWLSSVLLSYVALAINAYRNPLGFEKLTGLSTNTLTIMAFITTYFAGIHHLHTLTIWIKRFLTYIVLPLTALCGVGLTIVNSLTSTNFVYNKTHINFPILITMALLTGWIIFWQTSKTYRTRHAPTIYFSLGIVMLFTMVILSLLPFDVFVILSREDNIVEWVQVILLMMASYFACRISLHTREKNLFIIALVYMLAAITFAFVAGDEIAWGQRLLHITPSQFFLEQNIQKETTIHNLRSFGSMVPLLYTLIGLWGWASWYVVSLFHISIPKTYTLFVSRWYFFPFFFSAFLHNVGILVSVTPLRNWSEGIELMLYAGIALYCYDTFSRIKKSTSPKNV